MSRNQLPPQIRKVELNSRRNGRPEIRYEVRLDLGVDAHGKRRQSRKRCRTEAEARSVLASTTSQVANGTYVLPRGDTVREVIELWLLGRTKITESTLAGYRDYTKPVIDAYGDLPVHELTKAHIDVLMQRLKDGSLPKADGKPRRPFGPRARRYTLATLRMVLKSEVDQGHLARNVALFVDMPSLDRKELQTFTAAEAERLLSSTANEFLGIAWRLALSGLRRGEIAGLRWDAIDFEDETMTIDETLVAVSGRPLKRTPKTSTGLRTLPMPVSLVSALKRQQELQRTARILRGQDYEDSGYVVTDSHGRQVKPDRLTRSWYRACDKAKVPRIRLHDARHTCATLLHLDGVPIVVIAAWLGHVDAGFTLRTYAHSQNDALKLAAASLK
ncbi:tyrosine-type recombinase/integrase [Dietzia maris]|uniref:tyrosine-type recombinase/integrase n=1 Tax=Dietzia maris TaxID=37915 RepID=UPI0037C8DE96